MGALEYFTLGLLFAVGGFSIVCAAKNYEWFFTHRKADTFVGIFGRNGARIFYAIIGICMIICSIIGFMTWDEMA